MNKEKDEQANREFRQWGEWGQTSEEWEMACELTNEDEIWFKELEQKDKYEH